DLLDVLTHDVEGLLAHALHAQPVDDAVHAVERDQVAFLDAALHPRRAGRLDADDPDLRVDALGGHRDAGDQPAAADWHDDDVNVGPVADELEPDRALPHH